jgi:hypothetical protein
MMHLINQTKQTHHYKHHHIVIQLTHQISVGSFIKALQSFSQILIKLI